MTSFAATDNTSPPPLVRLTLTLGPRDRHAIAQFVLQSGAGSRTDAMRDLVARLSASSQAVRARLVAATVPPLPTDTSQSRRLDLRIPAPDRAAIKRWCAGQLRPQDALRAALHILAEDSELAVDLGYERDDAPRPAAAVQSAPRQPPRPEPSRRLEPTRRPEPSRRPKPPPAPPRQPGASHVPASRSAPRVATKRPRRRPSRPAPVASAWYDPPGTAAPWPPTPRTIPEVQVASSWQTSTLVGDLKSVREPIQFAAAWTDEVEDAVEDLVEVLGSGDSVTIVVGFRQDPWESRNDDGDVIASGTTWVLVPVRRPKSVAHEMLLAAHAAGGVNLEARVHRIEEEGSTGAIVELVVFGAF